ncbi:hypothetical protein Lser_V15G41191 [Lactuca serriola]
MDASLFSSDGDHHSRDTDEDVNQSIDLISSEFQRQFELESNEESSSQLLPDSEVHEDCENEGEEQQEEQEEDADSDGDFTFMFIGDDDLPIYADGVLEDGQIRPVFPLFDQKLLLGGEYDLEEIDRLPINPPVDNVFIESPHRSPSSTASGHEENEDSATGPYCVWSKDSATGTTAELSKKSNSTGFSKLWRLREKVGRSNSDGRDAFVFLKSSDRTTTSTSTSTTATSSSSSVKAVTGDGSFIKVNAAGGKTRVVKQVTKAKKPTVSAHEAYLKSKGGHTDEERRRSYLPYRPELMGFFTNVHGGLSKNVHPY